MLINQGDFVDRGYYSLETWTRLLTLKAKFVNANATSFQGTQVELFFFEETMKLARLRKCMAFMVSDFFVFGS